MYRLVNSWKTTVFSIISLAPTDVLSKLVWTDQWWQTHTWRILSLALPCACFYIQLHFCLDYISVVNCHLCLHFIEPTIKSFIWKSLQSMFVYLFVKCLILKNMHHKTESSTATFLGIMTTFPLISKTRFKEIKTHTSHSLSFHRHHLQINQQSPANSTETYQTYLLISAINLTSSNPRRDHLQQ